MMKTVVKVAVIVVTFIVAANAAEHIAALVSGTPTNELNVLMRKATAAKELAANLGSAAGCRLLTAHSEWIVFVYLPVASIAASLAARALRVGTRLALGVILILVVSRIVLMSAVSWVYADLASVCGSSFPGAGVSLIEAAIAFFLCILLTGAVLLFGHRTIPMAR